MSDRVRLEVRLPAETIRQLDELCARPRQDGHAPATRPTMVGAAIRYLSTSSFGDQPGDDFEDHVLVPFRCAHPEVS